MGSHTGLYPVYSHRIACPRCHSTGTIRWEQVPDGDDGSSRKQLVAIIGAFHERLSDRRPYPIELICDACGTVQQPEAGLAA
jgi:hypothetical protein